MILILFLMMISVDVNTQRSVLPMDPEKKLFIITLDGFRWQEVFGGADPEMLNNEKFVATNSIARTLYDGKNEEERRTRLLPFLWSVVAREGQVYGNRNEGNLVDVSNPYGLSYPGYSELLTGKVDLTIHNNAKKHNPNSNLLDKLNSDPAYRGKVAAFTSWDAFPFILNKKKTGILINSGLQPIKGELTESEQGINRIQEKVKEHETRYDELTFLACREYLIKKKPSVVFLGFSGTDDAGHDENYGQYLQQANNADRMIADLWQLVQSMPEYAGKTTFLITTDHGRGNRPGNWHRHGFLVPGSSSTWFALMGPAVVPEGEMKTRDQVYQKDLGDLVLQLLKK